MNETTPLFTPPPPPDNRKPWQKSEREGGSRIELPRAAAKVAIKRVEDSADIEWKERALEAVHDLALRFPELIANDLWNLIEKPREPRATGAVMKQAQKRGWITPTERFTSVPSVTRHAAPVRIWRSLIWEG